MINGLIFNLPIYYNTFFQIKTIFEIVLNKEIRLRGGINIIHKIDEFLFEMKDWRRK